MYTQKKSSSVKITLLLKVDLEGFEPLTSRMRTERSPNSLAFVHTLCTTRKEKSTCVRSYKSAAMLAAFLGRKYGFQSADFQEEAIWDVIWLAAK